ncbi:MAG: hypothetical protein K6L75_14025 [Cellvibrionaceae bacterium]
MEIEATTFSFGVDETDTPFAFVFFRDENVDFIFSLTRIVEEEDDGLIEFMVLDQILETVQDVNLKVGTKNIVVSVPIGLQKHTNSESILKINYTLNESQTKDLVNILKIIFSGKCGLKICI